MNNWVFEVSKRFSRVDRKGRSAATSRLASIGICFGVMSLIVVMSIMNGFQMSFIDSILEISSYHIRAADLNQNEEISLIDLCDSTQDILSVTPFYEAQTLITGSNDKESAGIIRAIDPSVYETDEGFRKEIHMRTGKFNIHEKGSIVLGATLAKNLGVRTGDEVNLLVLSGGSDVDLFSGERRFIVKGTFSCGYTEINSSYCFVNLEDAAEHFGKDAKKNWGIKIKNPYNDVHFCAFLNKVYSGSEAKFQTWRDYNKSFFGALRIEKNMLLFMVALIFVVVAINIYNGMRRLVFERKREIALFSALGATHSKIMSIFVMRGFSIGLTGAGFGLLLGILISLNTKAVFMFAADFMYYSQYFFTLIFNPSAVQYVSENSMYLVYANIPARIFVSEVIMIFIFGLVSPLIACMAASRNVLKFTATEVLHNE